ncbi:unnamed protein product [Mytilus coruscus]|uniref:Fibrinogen C-terminal domain-containing protein n=1 Tax=Mytilus coruscus TaxID=42192 RepID=A0A6J8F0N5_MYTCO|nr:unnamed protein product [Mytilus coruscus]
MKTLADIRNKAKQSDIKEGDNVLIRNEVKENKLTPSLNPTPQTVVKKKGTMITVSNNDNEKHTTRNASFFKKTNHNAKFSDQMDEEEEELDINIQSKENYKAKTPAPIQNLPTRIRKPPSYLQDYECKCLTFPDFVEDFVLISGDAMQNNNNMMFSTLDKDNDKRPSSTCVHTGGWQGGWWFNGNEENKPCSLCNLNGKYLHEDQNVGVYKGIVWKTPRSKSWYSFKSSKMTIFPADGLSDDSNFRIQQVDVDLDYGSLNKRNDN